MANLLADHYERMFSPMIKEYNQAIESIEKDNTISLTSPPAQPIFPQPPPQNPTPSPPQTPTIARQPPTLTPTPPNLTSPTIPAPPNPSHMKYLTHY